MRTLEATWSNRPSDAKPSSAEAWAADHASVTTSGSCEVLRAFRDAHQTMWRRGMLVCAYAHKSSDDSLVDAWVAGKCVTEGESGVGCGRVVWGGGCFRTLMAVSVRERRSESSRHRSTEKPNSVFEMSTSESDEDWQLHAETGSSMAR